MKDVVRSVIDGQKCCIFAYGQTGAGKTYTMNGGREEKERGIVPRSVDLIFETLKKYQDDGILTNETKVTMSCLEIYKEAVHDLLSAGVETSELMTGGKPEPVELEVRSSDDV